MQDLIKGRSFNIRVSFNSEGIPCLSCWGSSEDLMRTVLDSVRQYGKVYIYVNDCDDVDFIEA